MEPTLLLLNQNQKLFLSIILVGKWIVLIKCKNKNASGYEDKIHF